MGSFFCEAAKRFAFWHVPFVRNNVGADVGFFFENFCAFFQICLPFAPPTPHCRRLPLSPALCCLVCGLLLSALSFVCCLVLYHLPCLLSSTVSSVTDKRDGSSQKTRQQTQDKAEDERQGIRQKTRQQIKVLSCLVLSCLLSALSFVCCLVICLLPCLLSSTVSSICRLPCLLSTKDMAADR